MAGLVQSFVRTPVEQIKVVMQSWYVGVPSDVVHRHCIACVDAFFYFARNAATSTTEVAYRNTIGCVKHVVATEGVWHGLYRSLGSTIYREVPQYAMYYPLYAVMLDALSPADGSPPSSVSQTHPFLRI